MYKKHKIIMLPIEEKSVLFIGRVSRQLHDLAIANKDSTTNNQNLYIVSDEEIKEGDWFIANQAPRKCIRIDSNTSCPYITLQKDEEIGHFKTWHNIVIASTNPSLNLPQPSQSFIDKYISEYNKGNIITDIMVEYEEYDHDEEWSDISGAYETFKERVKVSKDNTITISKIRDSWSREEVKALLDELTNELSMRVDGRLISDTEYDKWIEQNL